MSVLSSLVLAAAAVSVVSPDGRNEIRLYDNPLRYEVLRGGETVVPASRIGLLVDGVHLASTNRVRSVADRSAKGTLATPVYKKSSIDLARSEKFAQFADWGVALVARNDGVAYRFELQKPGEAKVEHERFALALPPDARCWYAMAGSPGMEESVPRAACAKDIVTTEGAAQITTRGDRMVYLPLAARVGKTYLAFTESDVCDYPILNLVREGDLLADSFAKFPKSTYHAGIWDRFHKMDRPGRYETIAEEEPYLVKSSGTRTLPWRVFILADAPAKFCEADIVNALARPAAEGRDYSWVKPGKVAWDWWNHFDNADPKKSVNGGCNTKTYERFIDFAAKSGVEYVIFDEGWSQELDIWKYHPAVDVDHLVSYAAQRNVGIILWTAWGQIVGQEERVAAEFASRGVKGFKVDFMDRGDAGVERFLWTFAEACARHRLLVDYHGAHRPTGMSRTYPNVLNYEGVHGLEQMKWFTGKYDFMANDVRAFYLRLTAGPMDYTPGAMDNYPVGAYPHKADGTRDEKMYHNPGSEGTRCHQMAMMVLYEAPLQMLADSPTKYERNMESFRFMAGVPTVWQATRGLGGDPDSYILAARQAKDGSWYVAALGNADAHDFAFPTDFLGEGTWRAEIFRDGEDADAHPTHYIHETQRVAAGDVLSVRLAKGGGFVARMVK